MAFWAVAQTQNFSESKACRYLTSDGYECYLPKVLHVDRKRKRTREVALFAKYLFVRIVDRWHSIQSTVGVTRLLTNSQFIPLCVPDLVINELKSREDKKGYVVLDNVSNFKLGQKVLVVGGQFNGMPGLYNGMSTRQRERVLLQLLGQYVGVELNIDSQLEAVTSA